MWSAILSSAGVSFDSLGALSELHSIDASWCATLLHALVHRLDLGQSKVGLERWRRPLDLILHRDARGPCHAAVDRLVGFVDVDERRERDRQPVICPHQSCLLDLPPLLREDAPAELIHSEREIRGRGAARVDCEQGLEGVDVVEGEEAETFRGEEDGVLGEGAVEEDVEVRVGEWGGEPGGGWADGKLEGSAGDVVAEVLLGAEAEVRGGHEGNVPLVWGCGGGGGGLGE